MYITAAFFTKNPSQALSGMNVLLFLYEYDFSSTGFPGKKLLKISQNLSKY